MKEKIKILGVDVGRMSGWYIDNKNNGEIKFSSLLEYEKEITRIITLHNPDIVVSAKPTRFYNVIFFQACLLSIVELVCEKQGVQYHTTIDSKAKKTVFGKGKKSKKDIIEWAGVDSEHIADSKMFAEYLHLSL